MTQKQYGTGPLFTGGPPIRQKTGWRPVVRRLAFYAFLVVMCVRNGLAFSLYDESSDEVRAKEQKLKALKIEHRRVRQQLKYLDTEEGREVEAQAQGWIPPGSRLIVLPPEESPAAGANPHRKAGTARETLQHLAEETIDVFLQCRGRIVAWWAGFRSEK